MLTVYRSNRAELLAQLLAARLRLSPPGPFEPVQVVVNTWPTSRWLGEQLALGLGSGAGAFADGIAANLRFPFPGSHLRQLVEAVLQDGDAGGSPAVGADPWRANQLVWPLLELLPELVQQGEATLLRQWLLQRGHGDGPAGHGSGPLALGHLDRPLWQLGRAIADAFDDYTLYRPAMLAAWSAGQRLDGRGQPLPALQQWQPLLFTRLAERLGRAPFGLRVADAIERLRHWPPDRPIPGLQRGSPLRLFGLSSMAPVQVELLQALSGHLEVELYLLTPCRALWQRVGTGAGRLSGGLSSGLSGAALDPLGEDWLLQAPGLEARFGRLGAEFQQLLEGSGDTQLGAWEERDLFLGAACLAREQQQREPTLLEQLQQRLVDPDEAEPLQLAAGDPSLEFHACPGRLRQVQIVRDRILQLLAADASLAPRDILVMTPQVEAFAPLVGAVFGDGEATGVDLPWRLTDRSQQSEAGISSGLLALLELGGERLTASALEGLLACRPLLEHRQVPPTEAGAITELLQRAGFRWGLDGAARGGDPTHSLAWALDRLVLGLVLPEQPGLAPAGTAPLAMAGSLEQQGRWLHLLLGLKRALEQLARPRTPAAWAPLLRQLLTDLFGQGGERAWELQAIHAALADWTELAAASPLQLEAPVVAEVLGERLSADSGRFGHRSGALTISALEPMRAIPHRVIVLMGLDAGSFPRQRERPGFHLMEQHRQLGDPSPGDQDRYVLLESLLSARDHLLISWSSRDERTGEALMPSTPVRQWLALLEQELGPGAVARLRRDHSPNPLERRNFLAEGPWPPASCDRRLLEARRLLDSRGASPPQPLAAGPAPGPGSLADPEAEAFTDLQHWLLAPQESWLAALGLRPREWGQQVQDLEPLALEERSRASLLRQQLERSAATGEDAPDWVRLQRGQGVLPPHAAGQLEAQQLSSRWSTLRDCLAQLGEERLDTARQGDLAAELRWRSDALVLTHTARVRSRQVLQLWLELLLAAAAGQAPARGVLIGRDGPRFRVVGRFGAPPAAAAREQLEQLRAWREQFRQRCWPVPPDTGWAFAAAEARKPGSGFSKAAACWEGGFQGPGERDQEAQALCFGASLPARELLGETFEHWALELWQPVLALYEEVKP
ncbi:exodeoxyribonuclease V subunit gamma [Synechococcus sp. GreenBA-s]|nr:exodeoxyribonuclease V subunit gamma [Synechococcus sp. GreenBA-s]